jgi:hypothetical protein
LFYGDRLTIGITVAEFERITCDFFYRISNAETGKEMIRAKASIVFFDNQKRKNIPVPEGFKATLRGFRCTPEAREVRREATIYITSAGSPFSKMISPALKAMSSPLYLARSIGLPIV